MLPDELGASLASCLGLDVEHLELQVLKELSDVPSPLIHRTGYCPDVEPLPDDPCLKIHQTGYCPDVDLWGVAHLDVERLAQLAGQIQLERDQLQALRQLALEFQQQPQALVFEQQGLPPQVLALELV